ncbi:hypothetical protein [Modestobacter italicus]|uniref:hypothetical protein n=1 Tax=Modestobacter italicus (strain DSM 44449 / CECT 9708 / BC 501) TaxID=2732864 RepID=UPI001C976C97|nr:hypothetical protein [Modestobacter italicus]
MHPRATLSGLRRRSTQPRRGTLAAARRPGVFLGAAAAGAVLVNVLVGAEPAAQAVGVSEPVSVAEELGLSALSAPVDPARDLASLEQLAASRSTREAAETAAQQAQAAADQAELDRQRLEAEAAARAAEEAAAAAAAQAAAEAAAQEQAAAEQRANAAAGRPSAAKPSAGSVSAAIAGAVARITNNAGSVKPQVQRAADQVVSNVPGAAGITLGGTRASAADPGGHPSGLALDYMVMSDAALGDAIAQYHIDHWAELGVAYVIWEQRMLSSPGGSWKPMEDRGGVTANHFDHVHVNYR